MTEQVDYIALALKYSGYMEQDKVYLRNALAGLPEGEKKKMLVPPVSVLNSYFSELYQRRSPKEATDYFFGMSKAFEMFTEKPSFDLEGAKNFENFRFVRLSFDGRSFGYCYKNANEEAIIFSEFPIKYDLKLLFNMARIFPHYLIYDKEGQIGAKPAYFGGKTFIDHREVTRLTNASENDGYIRFDSYNVEDLLEVADSLSNLGQKFLQYDKKKFIIYQAKS